MLLPSEKNHDKRMSISTVYKFKDCFQLKISAAISANEGLLTMLRLF